MTIIFIILAIAGIVFYVKRNDIKSTLAHRKMWTAHVKEWIAAQEAHRKDK